MTLVIVVVRVVRFVSAAGCEEDAAGEEERGEGLYEDVETEVVLTRVEETGGGTGGGRGE